MKLKSLVTVIISIIFAASVMAEVLTGASAVQKAELNILRSDDEVIEVDFQFPGVSVTTISHGSDYYDLLTMEREGFSGEIGAPEVPVITRLFAIPDRAKVKILSVEPQFKTFNNIFPYPHQEYEYDSPNNSAYWAFNDRYYKNGELFPEKWAEIGEPAIMRDVRIIPVTISPIRVNATTGEAQILTSLHLKLSFEDGSTTNVKTHHFDKSVPSFNQFYRNNIANYDWTNPNGEEVMGSILIIYPTVTGVSTAVQPLIDWKTRKGYNTIVRTVPNGTSTTNIMNQINDVYFSANPPLEFVILIGDAGGTINIPCNYWNSGWYNGSSDHHYTLLEGGDVLADVFLGRVSVDNTTTLQTAVNKIIYYESNPTMTTTAWYKKGAVVAGSSTSGLSTIQVNQNIRSYWLEDGFTQVDTLWYPTSNVVTFITNECNSGITHFNYRGWIGVNGFGSSNVFSLNNTYKLPYAVIVTCGTGDFGGSGCSLPESWLRAGTSTQPKGGIGGIGTATSGTHTRYNNTICGELWFGVHAEGCTQLGPALFRGKLGLFNAYQQDPEGLNNFTYWNNLMGDPSSDLWNDIPHTNVFEHPDSIPVGTTDFTVTVTDQGGNPLPDRYVCLWKGTETYLGGRTDEDGIFNTPINASTSGTLKVTVTYHNDKPYLADVPVYTCAINPSFYALDIIDDNTGSSQGNGDGYANPSEILELAIDLKNYGNSTTATGVSAVLSSDDPSVTILGANVTYPDIAPGTTIGGNSHFLVQMGSEFTQGYEVQFQLAITTNQGNFTSAFSFDVNTGYSVVINTSVTGGSFLPGDTDQLTITLKNVGLLNLTAVSATLSSADGQVTVVDSLGTFGNINANATASNSSDPYTISADDLATNGRSILFNLHILSGNGVEQNLPFHIQIGGMDTADPFGPDFYGYYCVDNTDVEYSGHPVYNWIEISSIGEHLSLPDYSWEQDVSTVVRLPFYFTFYDKEFDTLTVCSNGWIGFGRENYHDDFRNYPMPSAFGPGRGMLCPFWDDLVMGGGGVYSYEDVANHTFIIEYHNVSHVVGGTEHFEVILYDPDYYPTATGDGEIVFQYQTVTIVEGAGDDNDFFTTGIENNEHTDGLQYAYWLVYTPGAPTLTSGKAIKFTTNEPVKVEYSNQVEITMTPSTQPIVIPPNGGSFSYTVAFENLATTPTVFDFWVNLTMPGGSNYGPVFMRQNIELGGSATLQRQLTEYIPGRAPAGNYTYNGLVGDYQTSTVWDQDSFPFTKSGVDAGGIGEWLVTGWEDNLPDALEVPENYILASPAPNPFNPATEIAYALPFSGKITLTVYNSVGQQVRVLVDGWNEAGWHSVEFDGKDLSSGLYFYTLKAGDFTQTQKMLLIK